MLVIFLNKFPTPTSDSYVSPTNLKLLLQASNEIACEWQDCMAGFVYLDGLRCEDRYDHIIPKGIPRNWCQIPNMTI